MANFPKFMFTIEREGHTWKKNMYIDKKGWCTWIGPGTDGTYFVEGKDTSGNIYYQVADGELHGWYLSVSDNKCVGVYKSWDDAVYWSFFTTFLRCDRRHGPGAWTNIRFRKSDDFLYCDYDCSDLKVEKEAKGQPRFVFKVGYMDGTTKRFGYLGTDTNGWIDVVGYPWSRDFNEFKTDNNETYYCVASGSWHGYYLSFSAQGRVGLYKDWSDAVYWSYANDELHHGQNPLVVDNTTLRHIHVSGGFTKCDVYKCDE